ncbi:MAG: aminotransferase class V-fold PLP-dependent enzyme [Planctomycetes bacterium]|nr:aminotransferase class V-fold PLP-dependent enzyme [Planctomycetota bacterium]
MSEIYLDANAGLPPREGALDAWARAVRSASANPASLHRAGRRAQGELERARERVSAQLRCTPRELVFTGGATEACNLALLGMVRARAHMLARPMILLSSLAEHPAVIGPLRVLQQEGHTLRLLPVDAHGRVDPDALLEHLQEPLDLIAMQWANNETGAVQDVELLVDHLPQDGLWFCDGAQGFGKLAWNDALGRADSLALSGHKFGAPRGIGAWVLREDTLFEAPITGGGHQAGRRPGTESPELAAALAAALELATQEQGAQSKAWLLQTQRLFADLSAAFPNLASHHPSDGPRLPNTLNLGFPGLDGRMLLPALDAEGLAISAGSACSSGSPEPSAVLIAAGVEEGLARASLRISLPPGLPNETCREAARRIVTTVGRVYEVANR